jgi:hypothetical protein
MVFKLLLMGIRSLFFFFFFFFFGLFSIYPYLVLVVCCRTMPNNMASSRLGPLRLRTFVLERL